VAIALRIIHGVLTGLHAAHSATNELGEPLALIHRDVSPDNVLVGVDGFARLIDFGVAKALGQSHVTRKGVVHGKLPYMAPEQALGEEVTAQSDTFMASLVLWQTLTGRRAIDGEHEAELIFKVLHEPLAPPSRYRAEIEPALDAVVMRGLEREPSKRWPSAAAMAAALETISAMASYADLASWLATTHEEPLAAHTARAIERASTGAISTPLDSKPAATATSPRPAQEPVERPTTRVFPWLGVAAGMLAVVVAIAALRDSAATANASSTAPRPSRSSSDTGSRAEPATTKLDPSADARTAERPAAPTTVPPKVDAPKRSLSPSIPSVPPPTSSAGNRHRSPGDLFRRE
jgi:serine/threonine-protein kinase